MGLNIRPIDLITTPVAVLGDLGVTTKLGLSADDPLGMRNRDEHYRVLVTLYDPGGRFAERVELDPLHPGERRLVDLGEIAGNRFGGEKHLAVVHRVPVSLCPVGEDPTEMAPARHGDFAMYRSMIQYGYPGGGHGGVIYETPPALNASAGGGKTSGTLTFTSKIATAPAVDTTLILVHYSVDPDYARDAGYRFRIHDGGGRLCAEREIRVAPFTVAAVSIGEALAAEATGAEDGGNGARLRPALHSLVGWSKEASFLVLFLQTRRDSGFVAVEHAHPPQTYLLPREPETQRKVKSDAIGIWDQSFRRGA